MWGFAFLLLLDLTVAAFGNVAGYVVAFVILGIIVAARRNERVAGFIGYAMGVLMFILFWWGLALGGGACVGWGCG
jgi:hypothetical protein